jgi:hypothetical protein
MNKILASLLVCGCLISGCTDYANYRNRDVKGTGNPDVYIEDSWTSEYREIKPTGRLLPTAKTHPCYGAGDKAVGTGTQVRPPRKPIKK